MGFVVLKLVACLYGMQVYSSIQNLSIIMIQIIIFITTINFLSY